MPYQCTACGKSFRYKVSERSHKCPSQPPGVIVRQAGDLLQKLQEKAAQHATGVQGSMQLSPASCSGPLQQQTSGLAADGTQLSSNVARQQLETASTSQFIIIVDNLRSSESVVVTPTAVDVSSQTVRVGPTAIDRSFPVSAVHPWSDSPFADEEGDNGKAKRSDDHLLEQTPDFFAVLDDLPSPSERLRNLTISPSLAGGGSQDGRGRGSGDTLQTINEESLKQLLLGFRD